MTDAEQSALLTICLMAAFADGLKDERERARVRQVAESLSAGTSVNMASLYQDVLLKRVRLADAVAALKSDEARTLAYEMALGVCDADGAHNAREVEFLGELRRALGLAESTTITLDEQAQAIAEASGVQAALPASIQGASNEPRTQEAASIDQAALDRKILNHAILNAALELLPNSLATMAIIPLQMKMVYGVGKAHGYELDQGHIKDLLATLGVGLTSQYLEQVGRKLLGGLLRGIGGSLAGGVGRQAASSAMTFATTYALGHVAKAYYAGGRTLSTDALKTTFQQLLGSAQKLREQYGNEIEQKSRSLDLKQILSVVKGQA